MRTNRTTLAAVLSIALAVAPSVVAAQTADEEPPTVSHWTSTETEGDLWVVNDGPIGVIPGGYRTTIGLTYTVEADDPRVSGDLTTALVYDYTGDDLGRGIGVSRLVNEGGSFEGTVHVVFYPDGSQFRMGLLEGQDGYEGLSYVMTNVLDPSGDGHPQGLIWEGEELPLPAADLLPE